MERYLALLPVNLMKARRRFRVRNDLKGPLKIQSRCLPGVVNVALRVGVIGDKTCNSWSS